MTRREMLTDEQKQHIRDWVAALRSGKYKQGFGALRSGWWPNGGEYHYCCLGVACDVFRKQTDDEALAAAIGGALTGGCGYLPTVVQQWLGVEDHNPTIRGEDSYEDRYATSAAALNDANVPFTKIADLIEATYLR